MSLKGVSAQRDCFSEMAMSWMNVRKRLGNVLAVGPKGVLEQREWKGLGEANVEASVSNDVRCM
jgi:hypothetical protein